MEDQQEAPTDSFGVNSADSWNILKKEACNPVF